MKKTAVIILMLMTIACAFLLLGCAPSEEKLTSYEINAVLNTTDMTITADETVNFVNNYDSALDSVYFHMYPAAYREGARFSPITESNILKAYPNGVDYGGITINSVFVDGEAGTYEIGGQDEDILMITGLMLNPEGSAEIKISFTLDIPQIRHRFGHYDNIVNLGNWYPIVSIFENNGWRTDPYYSKGDPFFSEVANYKVKLTTPTGWTVANTGTTNAAIDGEIATTTMTAEKVRDFAIVAGKNLQMSATAYQGVNIRYYYTSDDRSEYRLGLISDALKTFTSFFGEYPYGQLSVVKTHFMHGGMEYPQLVYVSDTLNESLFDDSIIHETAHQWWYGVVGSDEVRHAWLDEGLTEYSATVFYEKNPSYGISINDRIADAMKGYILFSEIYQAQMAGVSSLNRPLGDYFNTHDYVYHAYVKGELFFDSLRHLVGDTGFFAALSSYYTANMYKNASPEDLLYAFEQTTGKSLEKFFSNWLNGEVELYASVPMDGSVVLIEH